MSATSIPASVTKEEPRTLREAPLYLWLVFASAFLGWMFDAMDMSLFTLILAPSVAETANTTDPATIASLGGLILAIKLIAWGLGGIAFGFFADRFGRARTMVITIAIYSVFTAASAFATTWWQLALFQAIAGLGIGGEWAAGAALIAETWPDRLRAKVMQLMQMAFAFGFLAAALVNLVVGQFGWRWVFAAGLLPVVLSFIVRAFVKEPERWVESRRTVESRSQSADKTEIPSMFGLKYRRVTIVAILISLAMMVGSWGGLTWIPAWIEQMMTDSNSTRLPSTMISLVFVLMMLGAILGYLVLIWMSEALGRRWSYFLYCAGSLASSLYLFLVIDTVGESWPSPLCTDSSPSAGSALSHSTYLSCSRLLSAPPPRASHGTQRVS